MVIGAILHNRVGNPNLDWLIYPTFVLQRDHSIPKNDLKKWKAHEEGFFLEFLMTRL